MVSKRYTHIYIYSNSLTLISTLYHHSRLAQEKYYFLVSPLFIVPQIVLRKYLMLKETERQKAEASFFVSINFIYLLLKCVKSLSILFMVYNCAVCNLIFGKIVFNKTQAKLSAFGRSKNVAFHFF